MTDRISVFPGKYIKRTVRTAMLIFTIALFLFCNAGISANAYADIEIYKTAQTASFPSFFTTSSPKLKSLSFEKVSKNKCRATLTWYAKKGCCYQVLRRKPGGKYKVIATRRAVSRIGVYIDKNLKSSSRYIYTVRRYNAEEGKRIKEKNYDPEGLALLGQTNTKVDFQNLKAVISWKKVSGADRYVVYRRIGRTGKWKKLATVKSATKWTDVYKKTKTSEMKGLFIKNTAYSTPYIDPSNNPISYTVRAYSNDRYKGTKKQSRGLVAREGVFHLESPTVVSLSEEKNSGTLSWGTVPNADGYIIMRRTSSGKWKKIKRVSASGEQYQSAKVTGTVSADYYSVQAYSKTKDGKYIYSGYDKGFTHKNHKYGNKRVLYIGDSITKGSPYTGSERTNYAYPNRIQQLTGVEFFNASLPGATLQYSGSSRVHCIVNSVAGMIAEGRDTEFAFIQTKVGKNRSTFEDYDIVVLAAGTNDYRDGSAGFGIRDIDWTSENVMKSRTTNLTFTINQGSKHEATYTRSYDYNIGTFDGAYNQILKYIEEASLKRVMAGKPAIKVVSVGLFYSNRTNSFYKLHNRNKTANKYGYTLKDYQREINVLNSEWARSPVLDIYYYNTQSYKIVDGSNCSRKSADNLHFTKYTYGQYGNSMSSFLISNILGSADKTIDVNSAAVQALLARYGLAPAVSGSDDPDQPDPGMEQNDANNDAADNDSDGLTVYEDL